MSGPQIGGCPCWCCGFEYGEHASWCDVLKDLEAKKLRWKRLHPDAKAPVRKLDSAGYDLACVEAFTLSAGETATVDTGIALAIPEGHAGLIWDRSGLGAKGITVLAGCLDSTYRGAVKVVLHNANRSRTQFEEGPWGEAIPVLNLHKQTFAAGDRIAQLLIVPIAAPEVVEVDDLGETVRGQGGFGSTGRPIPNDGPDCWLLVMEDVRTAAERFGGGGSIGRARDLLLPDMDGRRCVGLERYKMPVRPHNGRDALQDAMAEILDALVYYRQAMAEERIADMEVYWNLMVTAAQLRLMIEGGKLNSEVAPPN